MPNQHLLLTAMAFAVSLRFIDQMIFAAVTPSVTRTCSGRPPARSG